MIESFWLSIAPPLVGGAVLSCLLESLLLPKPAPIYKRSLAAGGIHWGLWILLFAFALALFRRPYFAAASVLVFLLLLLLVNNAKFYSLREPFIFQDFEYFTDALKHPRLYIPFLGVGRTLIAISGFILAVLAGLMWEAPLTRELPAQGFFLGTALLAILGATILWASHRRCPRAEYAPITDLVRLGFLAFLWRYGMDERWDRSARSKSAGFATAPNPPPGNLPDLIVVQSESFFDVRRIFPIVCSELLGQFDALKKTAVCHGQLAVPAWGANTVRTEFSFLSGLGPEDLGVHRFQPYRYLARRSMPTLASFLKGLGYRTVCVHPYPASFYARDKVYPQLGFDEFLDIEWFAGAGRFGPFVADVAVAEKLRTLVESSTEQHRKPVFLFVITMENHGPLHLERVRAGDVERLYTQSPPEGCDDLTVYLRHLANADSMIGLLREQLEALPGDGWLCFFGDHVPILSNVYRLMGDPDGKTDYIIYKNQGHVAATTDREMKAEDLAHLLLQKMGLINEPSKRS